MGRNDLQFARTFHTETGCSGCDFEARALYSEADLMGFWTLAGSSRSDRGRIFFDHSFFNGFQYDFQVRPGPRALWGRIGIIVCCDGRGLAGHEWKRNRLSRLGSVVHVNDILGADEDTWGSQCMRRRPPDKVFATTTITSIVSVGGVLRLVSSRRCKNACMCLRACVFENAIVAGI